MKTKLRFLSLLSLCVLLEACVGFPKGDRLRFGVQSLAMIGTVEAVKHQPKTRKPFETTAKSLDALVAAGSQDPVALQNALTNLPIPEFKGPEGAIVVGEGAIVIQWLASEILIDTHTNAVNKYVAPVSLGLRDGIRQGLALAP